MAQKALLTINTEGTRERVVIDETSYDLTDFDSFNAIEQHKIARLGKAIKKLMDSDELDEADAASITKQSDELFEKISGNIPPAVKAKLRAGARQRITSAYFLAFNGRDKEKEEIPSDDGSATQSQDSKDSTAENSTTG